MREAVLVMDATSVHDWAEECVRVLLYLRTDIDGMNVYPVADSDTGSNLLTTLLGARRALGTLDGQPAEAGAGQVLAAFAGGAVRSARGNSGVILAQVLRGIAEAVGEDSEVDARGLARALAHADVVATAAVARPVEGTILSVLHAAATAAREAAARETQAAQLPAVADAAADAASRALAHTPNQLPVLAQAGVVDAGGRGLAAVLDALNAIVSGNPGSWPGATETVPDEAIPEEATADEAEDPVRVPAWEVMYLLGELRQPNLAALRGKLAELGDSVSIAEDGTGTHAVHVHCADIGAAIEAGLAFGAPRRIKVEPLRPTRPAAAVTERSSRGVVAVVRGDALAEVVGREGVSVLRVAADGRPSAEELLGLIAETASEHVTVLPGGPELTETAEEVAGRGRFGERDVVVVPCASPVQLLAALAVHDPARRAGDDVVAMAEAAAATRRGELRIAREESLTWVGTARAGAVLGLVDGEVVLIAQEGTSGTGPAGAAVEVLDRMLALGGDLVTVLTGERAPEGIGDELETWVRREHPEVEFVCYPGGHDDAVLLIGVE